MLKKIYIFLTFLICSFLLNEVFALGSGTSAMGNILLKDGTRLDSVRFEMPENTERKVKVIIDGKKRKLETDSIDAIVLWHKKHPENQYCIRPYYYEIIDIETGENKGIAGYPLWMRSDQEEENATYLHSIGRPDFKKGKLRFNYNALRSYQSTRFVLKKGSKHPCRIPASTKDTKKWVKKYFSDDPEVIRKLENGDYNFSDFGYKSIDIRQIVADYNPQ